MVSWGLLLALLGVVLAGSAAALDPGDVKAPAEQLRAAPDWSARAPSRGACCAASPCSRSGWPSCSAPTLALQAAAIAGGTYLVFFGVTELLVLLQRRDQTAAEGEAHAPARPDRRPVAGAAVAVAGCCCWWRRHQRRSPGARRRLRLRRGATARKRSATCRSTRRSSPAPTTRSPRPNSPGWFIINQRRTIARQLEDGIRLFLIDPHWGVETANGRVRTDFEREGRSRNKVAKAMPPDVLAAAERLAAGSGPGTPPASATCSSATRSASSAPPAWSTSSSRCASSWRPIPARCSSSSSSRT